MPEWSQFNSQTFPLSGVTSIYICRSPLESDHHLWAFPVGGGGAGGGAGFGGGGSLGKSNVSAQDCPECPKERCGETQPLD